MKKFKIIFAVFLLASGFLVFPLAAKSRIMAPGQGQNCEMVKTATLSINFSNVPTEIKDTQSYVDKKVDAVLKIADGLDVESIHIQNMSYNVYSNNSGGCHGNVSARYNLNGNVSFQIGNAEKAAALLEKLDDEGYNVNFNMNAYRQCR